MGLEIGFGVGLLVGLDVIGDVEGLLVGLKDGGDVGFVGLDVGPLDTQKLVFQDLLQHSS